jgi:hypothetical protein
MEADDDGDPSDAAVVHDTPAPRVTRLYGAVDIEVEAPPTIVDGQITRVTAPTPVVGSLLSRYRVGDVLGQGGMGEVLSARDEQIGRPVAINGCASRTRRPRSWRASCARRASRAASSTRRSCPCTSCGTRAASRSS